MNEVEILHDGVDFCVYYQSSSELGVPVVIKKIKKPEPEPTLIFQLKNEWEQTHNLSVHGIRRAYKLEITNDSASLYLEFVKGTSLRQCFINRQFTLKEIISIGIELAKILSGIHTAGIIHKDINPRNILVTGDLQEITLIDFGIATKLNLKTDYFIAPERLEGSLSYISPEQTGRMNRTVDHRSDLYSLGVTLYELLTRTLPFNATDAAEIIYAHIAVNPLPPHQLNNSIPEVVSEIVLKLLKKNAENRYQSAMGLKHDLEIILKKIEKNEQVTLFPLAQNDYVARFQVPQKLYGRENEAAQLLSYFHLITAGEPANCFITGFSGVGKSTLVHELYKNITESRGIFIEGKFDQYQRNIPYQAFSFAFKNFTQQLLSETAQRLSEWKQLLQKALGDNAGVITALIPEFEMIIGKQETPSPLGPIESQNRFNFTFIHFLREFASAQHPLILFLDDLQSADLASLSLLKALIGSSLPYFYFIGAYRNNEVSSEHPLQIMLNELTRENASIKYIQLNGLNEKSVNELVSDTLSRNSEETVQLSAIINKKTDGNPYFINEFLKSLYEEELIKWDGEKTEWEWDEKAIEQKGATENVVQFLTRRINAYPADTLNLMMIASCIGSNFSINILNSVSNSTVFTIHQHLEMMTMQGYLLPVGKKEIITEDNQTYSVFPAYKFIHDRFLQTVYSLISDEKRAEIHYQIGKYFLEQRSKKSADIFEVVNHLNQAKSIISAPEDKWQLCQLNYEAGLKAKDSSAWSAANQYFDHAMSSLPIDAWEHHYEFTFNIILEKAQAEFLNQNVIKAEQLMNGLLVKAHTNYDKAKVLNQKIVLYTVIGKNKEAIDVSKQCLRLLKVRIPRSSIGLKIGILLGLFKVKNKLRGKEPSYILSLPALKLQEISLVFRTISNSTTPAYFSNKEYFAILQLTGTNYSIKYGNSEYSAFCYACYAILEIALFRKYEYAFKWCNVLFALNDQYYSTAERSRMLSPISSGISHWMMPLPDTLPYFHEGYTCAMEAGELWYAGSSMVNRFITQLRMGMNLQSIHDEFIGFKNFVEKQNNIFLTSEYSLYLLWIKMMVHGVEESELQKFEDAFVKDNTTNEFLLGYLYTFYCRYYYLMGDHSKAARYAKKAMKLAQSFYASPLEADSLFYCTLALVYQNASVAKETHSLKIKKNLRLLETWEKNCPENFSAYAAMVKAESKRMENNIPEALKFFQEGAAKAKANKLAHVEALAYELAGLLCIRNNLKFEGQQYLQQAASVYARWGALSKVKKIQEGHPEINIAEPKDKTVTISRLNTTTQSTTIFNENLDLTTIMKASSAISGKVKFDELLNTMIKIAMENTGAQNGILFLENKDLLPKISPAKSNHVKLIVGIPMEEDEELPVSVAQYVYRTNDEMIIDNAPGDFRFSKDKYVLKYKPQSILCVPILQHRNFVGALYLENRFMSGVFTKDRLQLIRLLSGQIAVSIENSLAYETLEQKVEARTEEISKQKDFIEKEKYESDALLLNILPEEAALELKRTGKAAPQRFDDVTVIFTDFVSFSKISEELSPDILLEALDFYFGGFDEIISKYNLEKIKTIGDSYMCASGMPLADEKDADRAIAAAIDIRDFILQCKQERTASGEPCFDCRIGIHTGTVIAGVIGTKKFAYDIWGDTVNTAARMQQKGEPNQINISGSTYEKVKTIYNCNYRGKIEAKNKGLIDMYFVEGRR